LSLGEQQKPQLMSIKVASVQKNPSEPGCEMPFSHLDTDFMRHFMTRIMRG
ncbi:hypothetical protein N325_03614, partial [Colius striatus]